MRDLNWSAPRCLEVGKTRRTAERTGPFYRTVVAELVEDYLRAGWMIVLPSRAHPVGDAYGRLPIMWVCECEPGRPW
jgi:hypothetical protein